MAPGPQHMAWFCAAPGRSIHKQSEHPQLAEQADLRIGGKRAVRSSYERLPFPDPLKEGFLHVAAHVGGCSFECPQDIHDHSGKDIR